MANRVIYQGPAHARDMKIKMKLAEQLNKYVGNVYSQLTPGLLGGAVSFLFWPCLGFLLLAAAVDWLPLQSSLSLRLPESPIEFALVCLFYILQYMTRGPALLVRHNSKLSAHITRKLNGLNKLISACPYFCCCCKYRPSLTTNIWRIIMYSR
jgi:hypothetical protein